MAYSNKIKAAVRQSYVEDNLLLTQAANLHQVNIQTARSWKKKDSDNGLSWDKARAVQSLSQGNAKDFATEMINDQMSMHKIVIAEIKKEKSLSALQKTQALATLSDSLSKTLSSFKKVSPAISELAVALDVIKFQADYIKQHHPDLIEPFIEMLEPFGQELTSHYGE